MPSAAMTSFLHGALASRMERLSELVAREGWIGASERLHDVRVASRRARAALDLLDSRTHPRRKRLRALTRALGQVRTLDVQQGLLAALKHHGLEALHQAVLEHAEEILDAQRRKALRRLEKRLEGLQLSSVRAEIQDSAIPDVDGLPREARAQLASASGELMEELHALEGSEEVARLHALRIRLKRFRYAVEIFSPLLGGCEAELGRLRQLQTALGDHNDLIELEAFLWTLHSQLTSRRRAVLATELLDVLGLVAELRLRRFQEARMLRTEFLEEAPLARLTAGDPS